MANYIKTLNERQLYGNNCFNPNYFKQKVVKTLYDSSDGLYHVTRDKDCREVTSFKFSEDGNLLAIDSTVWRLDDELTLNESFEIKTFNEADILNSYFAKDFSKVWLCVYDGSYSFECLDLLANKTLKFTQTPVYSNNITGHPSNFEVFASTSIDGKIFLHDSRMKMQSRKIYFNCDSIIHSLQFNPIQEHLLLVVSSSVYGIYTLDTRNFRPVFQYQTLYNYCKKIPPNRHFYCYGRYNSRGDQIFFINEKCKPVLFDTSKTYPIFEFDEFGFLSYLDESNCCFAGSNDEYVVAPSKSSEVFVWEIPKRSDFSDEDLMQRINSSKFTLNPTCNVCFVDYNYQRHLIGGMGLKRYFDFWSPMPFGKNQQKDSKKDYFFCDCNDDLEIRSCLTSRFDFFFLLVFNTLIKNDFNVFLYNYEKLENTLSDSLLNEFMEDLNIIYIKNFINNQLVQKDKRKIFFNDSLRNILTKKTNIEEKIYKYDFLSVGTELWKFFLTKIFIKKSISYLKEQFKKVKKLKQKIILLNEDTDFTKLTTKLYELKRIKLYLLLMICDLNLIISRNKLKYKSASVLLILFFKIFNQWKEPILKFKIKKIKSLFKKNFSEKKMYKGQQLKNLKLRENTKIGLISFKEESKLDLAELRKEFIKKKKMIRKFFKRKKKTIHFGIRYVGSGSSL